jgi:hypothetical protein
MHKYISLHPITGKVPMRTASPPVTYKPSGKGIPLSTDLGYMFGPHQDQGPLGACTAFASLQWYAEWMVRQGKPWQEYSELAQYWEERNELGTTDQDSGANGVNAVDVLEREGVMPEADDPYNPDNFTQKPDESKFIPGSQLPANKVRQIPDQFALQYTLDALANGFPVLFGFTVFPELESEDVASNGVLPMPQPEEQPIGGHEVVVIGHDSSRQMLKVRNQWGPTWGDIGDFWMSFDYFTQYSSELYVIVDPAQPTPQPTPTPSPTSNEVDLWIGINYALVNGSQVPLDVAPIRVHGRTLVPIRFIAEQFGWTVEWNEAEQKITIIQN